jgi:hypothetical protein
MKFVTDCQFVGFARLAFQSTMYVSPGIGSKSNATPSGRFAGLNVRLATALVE